MRVFIIRLPHRGNMGGGILRIEASTETELMHVREQLAEEGELGGELSPIRRDNGFVSCGYVVQRATRPQLESLQKKIEGSV